MAAITALPVTVIQKRIISAAPGYHEVHGTLQIGNGTDTYVTGGITIDKGQLGLPNTIQLMYFVENPLPGGYSARYINSTGKVQLFDNVGAEAAQSVTPNSAVRFLARGY